MSPIPRRFRPRLAPSLAVAILLPLFLYLGYWQLQRADEKRVLQAEYDARATGAVAMVERRLQRPEALQFYRVVAKGHYEADRQILIDNRVHQGRVGYHVITPLRLLDSDVRLLVNRGWIAAGTRRDVLPQVPTPAGTTTVEGIAIVPSGHIFELDTKTEEAIVWQNLVLARYAKWSGLKLQPVVLQQTSDAADGLVRAWTRPDTGADKHRGYAFQWYSLASTILIAYVAFSFKRAA